MSKRKMVLGVFFMGSDIILQLGLQVPPFEQ